MQEIRAFVGHSFTEDDAQVVRIFLEMFDHIRTLAPIFSWNHAEKAEPKELADKVLSLISTQNAFIGICTRKERVVAPTALSNSWLRPGYVQAHARDVQWKTSDWIIQEIGLAVGLKLPMILLVETGVRRPGGLQGNVEYIEFDRANPQASYTKLIQMIHSLAPKASTTVVPASETKTLPSIAQEPKDAPEQNDVFIPKPHWNRHNYEFALIRAIRLRTESDVALIYDSYLNTVEAAQGDNKLTWKALEEYARLKAGKGGSLANLKQLSDENPGNPVLLKYLARAYEHYDDHTESAHFFALAAKSAMGQDEKLEFLNQAAVGYARAGQLTHAYSVIEEMQSLGEDTNTQLVILMTLRTVYEIEKAPEAEIAVLERMVELDPGDVGSRFSLAYKHSQQGRENLAILHYLKIPPNERDSSSWNNLGVAFNQVDIHGKSVNAYRKAEKLGETLAMSNLADKFISAGFVTEAEAICTQALAIDGYHRNVATAVARLKGLPDEEDKQENELLEKALPFSTFYRLFGGGLSRKRLQKFPENWQGPDCVLNVTVVGDEFRAVGSYERPATGLLALALVSSNNPYAQTPPSPIRYRVEYVGKIRGQAIDGHVSRTIDELESSGRTMLENAPSEPQFMGVLTGDPADELAVMEVPKNGSPRFYNLSRR